MPFLSPIPFPLPAPPKKNQKKNRIKPILNQYTSPHHPTISHCSKIQVVILYDLFSIYHFKNWIMFGYTAKDNEQYN